MVEDIGDVIGKGFETWKKNLGICLPFVFSWILTFILGIIIFIAIILAAIPSLLSYFSSPGEPPIPLPDFLPQIASSLWIIIAIAFFGLVLWMLIDAFFWAGAIGMAKEAILSGKTNISHMVDYGKRKFISLFFVDVIIVLISLVGIVFLIPGILYILPKMEALSTLNPGDWLNVLALLGLGLLAMIIYILIINIIFALPRFIVVIDDLNATKGIKAGVGFFMRNKVVVFLLWLIVFIANMISWSFSSIEYIGWIISLVLSAVVQALTAIWWSRLYLSGTGSFFSCIATTMEKEENSS